MKTETIYEVFNIELQNIASFAYEDIRPSEIDTIFNLVANAFVDSFYNKEDNKEPLKGLEAVQKSADDLRFLKKLGFELSVVDGYTDSFPTDYRNLDGSWSTVLYCKHKVGGKDTYLSKRVHNAVYESKEISEKFANPYFKSDLQSIISEIEGNKLKVYAPDDAVINKVYINYIRTIVPLSNEVSDYNEFPDNTILKLITLAVAHTLEIVASPRFQTKTIENTK